MTNYTKLFIKLFAWIYMLMGISTIYSSIYVDYLQRPWLIGSNYIPADFLALEMTDLYISLFICFLFIIGGGSVVIKHKRAYDIFLYTLIIYLLGSTLIEFVVSDYRYVLSKRLLIILSNFIIVGIPVTLILIEKRKQKVMLLKFFPS